MSTSSVVEEIWDERKRQVAEEGWTLNHDDQHDQGEMANAAACYASTPSSIYRRVELGDGVQFTNLWPWFENCWKPQGRRRNLIKAAALIVAEIERFDRLDAIRREVQEQQP